MSPPVLIGLDESRSQSNESSRYGSNCTVATISGTSTKGSGAASWRKRAHQDIPPWGWIRLRGATRPRRLPRVKEVRFHCLAFLWDNGGTVRLASWFYLGTPLYPFPCVTLLPHFRDFCDRSMRVIEGSTSKLQPRTLVNNDFSNNAGSRVSIGSW